MNTLSTPYKPNMIRGIIILTIFVIVPIIIKFRSYHVLSSSFFTAQETFIQKHLPFTFTATPIIPSDIQWKLEPSILLTPSSAALSFPQKTIAQIPTIIPTLIQATIGTSVTIVNGQITLVVRITDNKNNPLPDISGFITTGTQTYPLPATDRSGTTQLLLPYKQETITIHALLANEDDRISVTIP